MRLSPISLLVFFSALLSACGPHGGTARDPGSPTPAAGPAPGPGTTRTPQRTPGSATAGLPESRPVPVRADQAPLVHLKDALGVDSLLGRRVRVSGRCTAAGAGRRAGSWTLEQDGAAIEVRGLVPSSCRAQNAENLTIFAQIEPAAAGSSERLLLRLPD